MSAWLTALVNNPAMKELVASIDNFPAVYGAGMSAFKRELEQNITYAR